MSMSSACGNEEPIHAFVPKFRVDECLEEIRECLTVGWTGMGFKTKIFEDSWKQYEGIPHAHFVSSATAALHLALEVLKRQRGWSSDAEIISPSLTFISTNHVIQHSSLTPVMADVDKFLCLDPESVRARITEKTRAVLFVGLGGRTGELEKIRSLCDEYGLALILDAAHMAGTKLNGISPARYADVTCYSFQAVKNLPTSDSGMVCFQDSGHDAFARQLSWLGINKDTQARTNSGTYSWDYEVMEFGFKYNGNSVAAALGIVGLRHLDEDNTYRRWLAGLYDGYLSEIGQVSVVPSPANCVNSSHIYQILVHNRDAVIEKLHTHNIYPGVHYRDNTNYWMYKDQAKWVPNARRVSDLLISLPLHLNMGEPEVARIAQVLRQVV